MADSIDAGAAARVEPTAATGLLSNAGWLTFGRLAGDVLGFVLFVALSRRFGPAGIGKYAYGFAVSGFVYVAAILGMEDFGVREFSRLPRDGRRRLLGQLLVTQCVLLCLIILGLVGFLFLGGQSLEVSAIILLFSGYQIALALSRTLFIPAFAEQRMVVPALIELVCRGLGVAGSLVLVVGYGASLLSAVAVFPISGAILLFFAIQSPRRLLGSIDWRVTTSDIRSIISTAWPFAVAEVVFQFYARADVILVLWILGEAAAGIYASAFKFVEVGLVPIFFLGLAAYPGLSRLASAGSADWMLAINRLVTGALSISGLVSWGLVFVVPLVASWLLGDRFHDVGGLVRIMAALPPLMAIEIASSRVLLASNRQIVRVRRQVWATGLNVALNLALIPYFGATAAACTAVVGLIAADVLYLEAAPSRAVVRVFLSATGRFLAVAVSAVMTGAVVEWLTASPMLSAGTSLVAYLGASLASGNLPHEVRAWLPVERAGRP